MATYKKKKKGFTPSEKTNPKRPVVYDPEENQQINGIGPGTKLTFQRKTHQAIGFKKGDVAKVEKVIAAKGYPNGYAIILRGTPIKWKFSIDMFEENPTTE